MVEKEKKHQWLGDWRYMLTMALGLPVGQIFMRGIDDPRNKDTAFLIGTFLTPCLISFIVYQYNQPKLDAEDLPEEKSEQFQDYKSLEENESADPWEERDRE